MYAIIPRRQTASAPQKVFSSGTQLAQAKRKKKSVQTQDSPPNIVPLHQARGPREALMLVLSAMAIYLAIALLSYQGSDPGWASSGHETAIANAGGRVGAWFASLSLFLCGYLAYSIPFMVGFLTWYLYQEKRVKEPRPRSQLILRCLGFALFLLSGTGLAALHFNAPTDALPASTGGVLGELVSDGLVTPFSFVGATLFLIALFLTGITLLTDLSWLWLMDYVGKQTLQFFDFLSTQASELRERMAAKQVQKKRLTMVKQVQEKKKAQPKPRIEPVVKPITIGKRVDEERQIKLFKAPANQALPSLSLLDEPEPSPETVSPATLEAISRQVELKLMDFGVEVQVVAVHPGPVITRFELQPAAGVKVSRITNLAKDLARALSAISVRIVEVIPGKSVIGLEIPNHVREIVRLREILQSKAYEDASRNHALALALGKDVAGHAMVVNLTRMPHLLIAGTTGSGKSVGVNAMILSLLYNLLPKDLRMIMIDPKMLELSIYEGIPHLLAPVVTDMKEAANALRWCVAEMERRYALMAAMGVRNIANYNRKVSEAIEKGEPIKDPLRPAAEGEEAATLDTLPVIVVVIDELADMMMIVGKKVEQLIARLAQKARASGIHLILATQRPSVDVITGLIKANIPTRIAFQVSSRVDSRTILDQMGAEQLLGHGDMLYLPPGTSVPTRIHGAFVDDNEVHQVVEFLRQNGGEPDYIEEILQGPMDDDTGSSGNGFTLPGEASSETDPLYDQAVRIVTETRRASISGVQRRLKIGYNRAARMVEDMERAGVVGPLESNGNREVLAPPPPKD
ncbi:MAG: cell division protein FtsK [Gammaproteobacteria bacterium]|nr:cell division protein FtsK [Gammaproteobacteria bacterium]